MEKRLQKIEEQNDKILKAVTEIAIKSARTETKVHFLSLGLGGIIVLIMDIIKSKLGI